MPAPLSFTNRTVLTPSQLNASARALMEQAFPPLWLEGEVSNLARPGSGHLYFSLKDSQAQLRCVLFKPHSTQLRFRPADGMQVMLRGRVGFYEARGEFQFIAEHMEPSGEGALRRAFEALKLRLQNEGLFEADRKRRLPRIPRHLGVLTSPSGAAVRDVLSILARRWPLLRVDVLPVPVQGEGAAAQITNTLQAAARSRRYDVLLLTRGGGSLEDLWAFNDERLTRAIAASPVPVVSAVGHEVDFSISDFVADLRAPTPSAAAELLVPNGTEVRQGLAQARRRLELCVSRHLQHGAQRCDLQHAKLQAQHPLRRLAHAWHRLHGAAPRMRRALERKLESGAHRTHALRTRWSLRAPTEMVARHRRHLALLRAQAATGLQRGLAVRRTRLQALARALNAMSPLATLARGYAIVRSETSGTVVQRALASRAGDVLRLQFLDGTVRAHVSEVMPHEP